MPDMVEVPGKPPGMEIAVRNVSLSTIFLMATILVAVLSVVITGGIWMHGEYMGMQQDVERLRHEYLEDRKAIVHSYAVRAPEFARFSLKRARKRQLKSVKSRGYEIFHVLKGIWQTGNGLSHDSLKTLGFAALKGLSKEGDLPFFLTDQQGRIVLFPADPTAVGSDVSVAFGRDSHLLTRELAGVDQNTPHASFTLDMAISGMTAFQALYFAPLKVRIVTYAPLGKMNKEVRSAVLERLAVVTIEKTGKLAVARSDGSIVLAEGKISQSDQKVWTLPGLSGLKGLWRDSGNYRPPEMRMVVLQAASDADTRLVAFQYLPEWDWIVFADLPVGDLASLLADKEMEVRDRAMMKLVRVGIFLVAFLIAVVLISRAFSHYLRRGVHDFMKFFDRAGREPVHIDEEGCLFSEFKRLAKGANRMVDRRQEAFAAALEGEQRYRATFETAAVGIAHVSLKARWLQVNDRLCELLGKTREELLETKVSDTLAPGETVSVGQHCRAFMEANLDRAAFEQRHVRPDGTIMHCRMVASPVRDVAGAVQYCVLVVADIGEQKLIETTLRTARDAAEASNRAKGEFLANMSHELRTPLNGVLGMLQLLEDSELDEDQRESVRLAMQSGKSLLSIIGDVLDLSRMEAGRLGLNREPFRVAPMLEKVLETFAVLAREKGVGVDLEVDSSVPDVLVGDEMRLRQILFNLVGNAVKFSDRGTVLMKAEAISVPGESDVMNLIMTVVDEGIGIPEDKLSHIFEDFAQLDGSHTRKYQGTGLGLGIVRRLVGLMGGHVNIVSEIGKGTEITFVVQLERPGGFDERRGTIDLLGHDLPGLTVLVVEDDPVNARVCSGILERVGHEVTIVGNGRDALESMRQSAYDIVLMDIQMPVMDGLEAVGKLRTDPDYAARAGTPVIAITAHADAGDREQFLAAGMTGYISKPVDRKELLRVMAEVMSRNHLVL